MPQFDQFSFLNQVFWALLIFSGFYFFVSYFLLPKIGKILKFRLKKVRFDKIINNNLTLEQFQFFKQLNDSYITLLGEIESNFLNKKKLYLNSFNASSIEILKSQSFIAPLRRFHITISTLVNNYKNV